VLVGDGEDKAYFTQLAHKYNVSNEMIFKGEVTDQELVSLYLSSDVFVLPSLSEVCPTVVMEAMYFSLPVVSTYIPGIYDHFKDVALLVPPKDETLLAEGIVKLYFDEELRKRLSTSGHELICKKYTWHQISNEYAKIYGTINGDVC
jgi:glycosyltransferase involved in cell wall biosynthesis